MHNGDDKEIQDDGRIRTYSFDLNMPYIKYFKERLYLLMKHHNIWRFYYKLWYDF